MWNEKSPKNAGCGLHPLGLTPSNRCLPQSVIYIILDGILSQVVIQRKLVTGSNKRDLESCRVENRAKISAGLKRTSAQALHLKLNFETAVS